MVVEMLVSILLLLAPVNDGWHARIDEIGWVGESVAAHEAQVAAFTLTGAALAVADCESGDILKDGSAAVGSWRAKAENPRSSASGAFQAVTSTWEGVTGLPAPASAYPMDVQLAFFEKLWDGGRGASHWAPSRSCWSKILKL